MERLWLYRLMSLVGLLVMVALAWAMSENRRKANWRLVAWGLGLQFGLGVILLRWTFLRVHFFDYMSKAVGLLLDSTIAGSEMVFGNLATDLEINAVVAFQVLPVIIFVSAFTGVLYHLRVIQTVVRGVAWLMRRTLKTSGAETFGSALLIFLGIESMVAVRGYLREMTRSELATLMTTFMATIAGSVMVVYATFGAAPGHLLTASLMSAPAAILISKLMVPELGEPRTSGKAHIAVPVESHNLVDAAARGTADGLKLALNIGAMLIAFVGMIFLLDAIFTAVIRYSFTDVMALVFRPFAALLGVPVEDNAAVGALLAKKTVFNEFLAYVDLREAVKGATLSPRSITIATYALCGFANPGSVGIVIAGMSGLVPERRHEIVQLALKAFIGGTLACFMTACVAGILT
ncbi:MAG TPA: NupC/NupG family nucleoside CNT transporter [Candidatus Hydrogenedentes bacterium]|nr:NupC/NupG family nucleoside CNT transporter [Candidatus Hydrogenedentota bacterium]HIJ73101.1 NupC/NupG family nucleoside CNT transporter [Candidatus Hydrogenedentota bacterium]